MEKAKIIVLKTLKHSESDLLVQALDSQGDRLHFIAKGALKSKRRFGGGVLEPTHYLDVLYKSLNKSSDDPLYLLLEAKVLKDFQGMREDYDRLSLGLFFVSLVHKLTRSGAVGAKEVFDLLGHSLSACENCQSVQNLKLQFQAKLLYSQGILEHSEDWAPFIRTSLKESEKISVIEGQRGALQRHLDLSIEEMLNL